MKYNERQFNNNTFLNMYICYRDSCRQAMHISCIEYIQEIANEPTDEFIKFDFKFQISRFSMAFPELWHIILSAFSPDFIEMMLLR